ncbi:MAG: hypothetical protein AAF799_21730 [Myxococcota bacterium]
MFEIQSSEVQTLRPYSSQTVDRLMVELRIRFPQWCAEQTDEQLRGFILCGCEDAVMYGFNREEDVVRMVTIFAVFGLDFVLDRRMKWATRFLNPKSPMPAPMRIQLLHERVMRMVGLPVTLDFEHRATA